MPAPSTSHSETDLSPEVSPEAAPGDPEAGPLQRARGRTRLLWLTGALVVALLTGGVWWWAAHRGPGQDTPEVGFARDMYAHHGQAVVMSSLVRNTVPDPALNTMTEEIMMNQAEQQGIMRGWLEGRHVPAPDSTWQSMAWMHAAGDHQGDTTSGSARMPGMADDAELTRLARLEAREREVLYLQLMVRHHQGGLEMARAYLDRGHDEQLTKLARGMVTEQEREITVMQGMLADRGAA